MNTEFGKGCYMMDNTRGIQLVTDDELRLVRGGKSFWDRRGRWRWIKKHVVATLKSIAVPLFRSRLSK
jgi:hypothetical protein